MAENTIHPIRQAWENMKAKSKAFKAINIKMENEHGEEKTYLATIPAGNYDKIRYIIENPAIPTSNKIAVLEWAKKETGVKLTRNPVKDYEKIMNSNAPEKEKLLENIKDLVSEINKGGHLSFNSMITFATSFLVVPVGIGTIATGAGALGLSIGSGIALGLAAPAFILTGIEIHYANEIDINNSKIQEDILRCFKSYKTFLKDLSIKLPDFAIFLNYTFSQNI